MNNLKIFPYGVLPDGKRIPLIDNWQHKASSDPAQIKLWQDQYKDRIKGWALPTGSVNNLWVLDIDVKEGRNGFHFLQSQGITLPSTMYQQTPSGGLHLFFQNDPNLNLRNTVDRETGVDSRGESGFVWLYNIVDNPVLPIPDWALNITKRKINQIDPNQVNTYKVDEGLALLSFQRSIQAILAAQPGERNHTLNTHAFLIGQLVAGGGIPKEFAEAEISKAALAIGLDPHEIQATIRSGIKGGLNHPPNHPFGDKPPIPAVKIETPLPEVQLEHRWTPVYATVDQLKNRTKLKKPQLFKDWSTEDIHLTSAIGGVGKTTLKLFEAVCLALGEPFLDFPCIQPGKTLFVIGEDSEEKVYAMLGEICRQMGLFEPTEEHRLQAVIRNIAIKLDNNLPLVQYDRHSNCYAANQESLSKIFQAIEDLQPRQIIFDPIAMFSGPEHGGNDMAMALSRVMQVIQKRSNASIDMISHIGKDSATKKDVGQFSARGATALANHSRVIRTLLKLNADEYAELTGEQLDDHVTAIQCFISKFSDGSPLLDGSFLILRRGFLFAKKLISINAGKGINIESEKARVLNFVKANSTLERPLTEKFICDHFYLQNPRMTKTACKSAINSLVYERVLVQAPHPDQTVGDWIAVNKDPS